MKLETNIKIRPHYFRHIPILWEDTAYAIYPNIYLPKEIYENLLLDSPNPESVATLIHEQFHIQREKEIGPLWFAIRYFFSRRFRWSEEMAARRPQIAYLKRHGQPYDIEKEARKFSGPSYQWALSYTKAKSLLEAMWKEA